MPVVFGANSTASVPLPLPEALVANVIHGTVDVALQLQPVGVVTVIVCVPPTTFKLAGETIRLQTAPAWVTSTALSAIVTVAERGEEDEFAAIVIATAPAPEPPEVFRVIHGTGDCAVQEHPRPAVTNTLLKALVPFTFTAVGDVE
jgi:hypothetical protein